MLMHDAAFYGERISDRILKTPEGFLICKDVRLARTGVQQYSGRELPIKKEGIFDLWRLDEDVFDKASLCSFEGKPIVDDHPPDDVELDNYSTIAKGHVQNVRHDDKYVIGDLFITSRDLIDKVMNGKREISVGYSAEIEKYKTGYKQKRIRVNHIAVVDKGRAGPQVLIRDMKPINIRKKRMNRKEALSRLLVLAAKDAEPAELTEIMTALQDTHINSVKQEDDSLFNRINEQVSKQVKDMCTMLSLKDKKIKDNEAEEEIKSKLEKLEQMEKEEQKAKDEDSDDEKEGKTMKDAKLNDRLENIEKCLAKLLKDKKAKIQDEDEDMYDEDMTDEDMTDEDDEEMKGKDEDADEGEKESEKAEKVSDAFLKDFKSNLKKQIAKLPPKAQQAAKDAFRDTVKSGAYGNIQKSVQKARDSKLSAEEQQYQDFEKRLNEKYNPHYKA